MKERDNSQLVGLEALNHLLLPPKGAFAFIKRFFDKRTINASQAANSMNVSPSTVTRFLNGGSLTTAMAAKLSKEYGLDIGMLFRLEAQAMAYQAEQILLQDVA